MKSTLDLLTPGERELLANFMGTATHTALVKLLELERLELAKDHVGQHDIKQVRFLSGKSESLKNLILTLKTNGKTQFALEKKKVKQKT